MRASLSLTRNRDATPVAHMSTPKNRKKANQSPRWVQLSKTPKITSMEMSGRMARTDSARPRFSLVVTSVT